MKNIQIQAVEKPLRKAIIKRGIRAEDYFSFCEEAGCEIWEQLVQMDSLDGEPICMWLPENYITPGTSQYVQGVEAVGNVPSPAPDGFDMIDLPEATYLRFQGPPFEEDTFSEAIETVWTAIEAFDPSTLGYVWDDTNPRIQLEPRCERGYVELRAVRKEN